MSRPKSNRYKNQLEKLVQERVISSDGADWLVSATDPFHDDDITLAGYPDTQTASTVVQLVKQQFTITAPSTVSSPDIWDCNIVTFPTYSNAYGWNLASLSANNLGVAGSSAVAPYNMCGVQAVAGASGVPLFPNADTGADSSAMSVGLATPSAYLKGKCRIIGSGFEVVNTTAAINRQGQVTYWRQPSSAVHAQLNTVVTFATVEGLIAQDYDSIRMPPSTLSKAQLLYGSRTELAERGAYTVARLNSTTINMDNPQSKPVAYTSSDAQVGNQPATVILYSQTIGEGLAGNTAYPVFELLTDEKVSSFDLSGAYFTGLSYTSTLVITCRWLIERCPTTDEFDLVVLASPSACYDPVALEIYSQAMCHMPPGVCFDENPFGEWFSKILDGISLLAPGLGSALTPIFPPAGFIGNAIGQGAGFIRTQMPNSSANVMRTSKVPASNRRILSADSNIRRNIKKKKNRNVNVSQLVVPAKIARQRLVQRKRMLA